MNVKIYSREAMEEFLKDNVLDNTAVITFYDPPTKRNPKGDKPVDYTGKCDRVFPVCIFDIDLEVLGKYGLTCDTYFPEVDRLAKFIYQAKQDGLDIICQCEHGQSRSAACAAAILEHFYRTGISVFADYRYYPNQLVYHKVFNALGKVEEL
ncbi:MAG: dual specificity protein phosphatase family protein [Clostridiales bacterium]|nr:dual specificity protein phosphatase family protein [Clostridiales bacterium]